MQRPLWCMIVFVVGPMWATGAAGQPVVQMQQFEQSGTVAGGTASALTITVLNTQTIVQIDSRDFADMHTKMELKATAKNSLLVPGALVRFSAKFDAKGKRVLEPISQINIFSRTPETRFGVFTDDAHVPALDGDQPQVGIGAAPQPKPKAQPDGPAAGGEAFVVGQITRARKGEISVQLPNRQIEAKLAADVAIDVHYTDKPTVLALLRPGDPVHVQGMASPAGKVYATTISVNLHRQLGEDVRAMRPSGPVAAAVPKGAGDKTAEPEDDEINRGADFGVAAAAAAEEAAAEEEAKRAGIPQRARILKVN